MMENYQDQVLAFLKGEMSDDEKRAFEETLVRSAEVRMELERSRELLGLLEAASEKSLIERVNTLIREAIERGASDIHVVPARDETLVSLRIDGVLHPAERISRALHQSLVDRWKVLADMHLHERRLPQDGRFPVRHDGSDFDMRVSILPTLYGERVTARILDRSHVLVGLDKLGLTETQKTTLTRLARRPSGLLVAGGRAGTGKTTTLYSLLWYLREVSTGLASDAPPSTGSPTTSAAAASAAGSVLGTAPRANIMTVEDPVELTLSGISQTAVNGKNGLTYADALRGVFRSDPDLVYCAATRSLEIAELLAELATTGHLVLTALHVSGAVEVIVRLRDMGVEPFLVADMLAGAWGQRLVRKICPDCREEYAPDPDYLGVAGLSPDKDGPFTRGRGCNKCAGLGYRGRTILMEVFETDANLRRLIADNASADALWAAAFGKTGGSLWDDARAKISTGVTTVEEAARVLFDYRHAAPRS
jgi:type II secretory ATPase GspE/PulE/Tfp pilus assembly ATPase PilB-like protein